MNFDATNKIEKEIINLPQEELEARIVNSKNNADKLFWSTLKDRALQDAQKREINRKEFIR